MSTAHASAPAPLSREARESFVLAPKPLALTEVRIKIMTDENNPDPRERLLAFASIVFADSFVVRDLKILNGDKGIFLAMPSRKLMDRCPHCFSKNHLRSRFCNECGCRHDEHRAMRDADCHAKLHADVAHPITPSFRLGVEQAVVRAYHAELERSKEPGYVSAFEHISGDDGEARG